MKLINHKEIVKNIIEEAGFKFDEVCNSQKKAHMDVKKNIILKLRNEYRLSYTRIAEILGYKDHTSIMYIVKSSEKVYFDELTDEIQSYPNVVTL